MGSGDSPGLQNRCESGIPRLGSVRLRHASAKFWGSFASLRISPRGSRPLRFAQRPHAAKAAQLQNRRTSADRRRRCVRLAHASAKIHRVYGTIIGSTVMDVFSTAKRSEIMRRVKSEGTRPEAVVGALLAAYRLRILEHPAQLPGKPDFAVPSRKLAVFVHGCFWHNHSCPQAALPASNDEYWRLKIERNRKRDRRVRDQLRRAGWQTAVIWECRLLRHPDAVARRLTRLLERQVARESTATARARQSMK